MATRWRWPPENSWGYLRIREGFRPTLSISSATCLLYTSTPAGATLVTKTYYDGTVNLEGGTGQREMETRLELTSEGILTTTLSKGCLLYTSP